MKAIGRLTPFLTFALLAVIAFSPLQNLWNADWAIVKSWYPNLYLPAYAFVKLLFPVLAFFAVFFTINSGSISKRSIIIGVIAGIVTGAVIELLGLRNLLGLILLISTLVLLYRSRHNIKDLLISLFRWNHSGFYKQFIWYLILVVVLAKIIFAFWAENSWQGDAACRYIIAHIWSHYYWGNAGFDKILNPNIDWLPIHFYITGTAWKLTHSEHLVLLLHTLADICGAFFLYRISNLFASKEISLAACLCYLLYPANFFISAAIMSEPWFLLAILATFYFFLQLNVSDKTKYYLWYALALNAACLLRYEAWPLVVILPCIHFAFTAFRFNRQQFIFLLTLFAPLGIMGLNYYQGFHPLRGILYSDEQVNFCYNKIGRTIFVLMNGYKSAWIPGVLLFSLYALFKHFKTSATLVLYAAVVAAFSLPFLYKVATFSIMPDPRYLIFYEVLMLPLFIKGVFSLPVLGSTKSSFIKAGATVIVLLFVSVGYIHVELQQFQYPEGFDESVEFTEKLDEGRFILDHHHGLKTYSWITKADLPIYPEQPHWYLKQFIDFKAVAKAMEKQGTMRYVVYMVNDYESEFKTIDFAAIDAVIEKGGPVYLTIFPDGPLDRALHFTNEHENYKGRKFERLFENNGYRIYRLAE